MSTTLMGVLETLPSGWDGFVVIVWVCYQYLAWDLLGRDTILAQTIHKIEERVDEQMSDVKSRIGDVEDTVDRVDEKQTHLMQVTRANSRALDEEYDQVSVDSDMVDEYLMRNGVHPQDFHRNDDALPDDERWQCGDDTHDGDHIEEDT